MVSERQDSNRAVPTIFALATAPGRAAVAILRLSGPATASILATLGGRLPAPRRAALRALHHRGVLLDRALVIWMPAPASYSGEDSGELHLHGGHAVIEAVAESLLSLGAHPAAPGEFTRRAFLHGRLDLLEAEAVADLVAAETEAQRRQALGQMQGLLSRVYQDWSVRLRLVVAQQEALIDFPDEALPPDVEAGLMGEIARLLAEVSAHLDDGHRGERLRDGLTFAIVGAPNVGKSSLLNALARREAAIVSPIPGTTRDAIEVRLDLAGVPVTLVDTAGLRAAVDAIEAEGIRRARAQAEAAHLVVLVSAPGIAAPEVEAAETLQLHNKSDLGPSPSDMLAVSALSGHGLQEFEAALAARAAALTASGAGTPMLTRQRHRQALDEMLASLRAAQVENWPELRGEALRVALHALGRITGQIGVEDLLDTIFGQFCIGK